MNFLTFVGCIAIILIVSAFLLSLVVYCLTVYRIATGEKDTPMWIKRLNGVWIALLGVATLWFVFATFLAMVSVV